MTTGLLTRAAVALAKEPGGAERFAAIMHPQVMVRDAWVPDELDDALRNWDPKNDAARLLKRAMAILPDRAMAVEIIERFSRTWLLESALSIRVLRSHATSWEDYGVVGRRVITDTGVAFLVDAWQNIVELEIMKYHGLGTGVTAEAQTQTALVTELTTEYTGNVRATGTTTEGATGNIFKTVGSNLLDGTPGAALREHAILSQAATGGGTMFDRTLYAAITLSSGDTLESSYEATCSANG